MSSIFKRNTIKPIHRQQKSKEQLIQENLEQAAALAQKLEDEEEYNQRFDPYVPGSRATATQQAFIDAVALHKYAHIYTRGGNQSKPGYAQILMADRSCKAIRDVRVGDKVKTFDFATQTYVDSTVTEIHNHGRREVSRFFLSEVDWVDMTADHEMVDFDRTGGQFYKKPAQELQRFLGINTLQDYDLQEPARSAIPEKFTALLGYLLGDGCLTSKKRIQFTNNNREILDRVAGLLDSDFVLARAGSSGNYMISPAVRYKRHQARYLELLQSLGLQGCYAHEKFIPPYIFEECDRVKLAFIEGLIATDGWVTDRLMGFCSVSYQLIKDLQTLLITLGIRSTIGKLAAPQKATHRQAYRLYISNAASLEHLAKYLHIPSKPITKKPAAQHKPFKPTPIKRHEVIGEMEVYDITVDHADHNYICDGFITGNSGKTVSCAYIIGHLLREDLPKWKRRPKWGNRPLLLIWASPNSKQIEDSLWLKLKGYLTPGTFREWRSGGSLQRITMNNGNTLLFVSYHDIRSACEIVQSFTAHYAFIDELPSSPLLIEELQNRVLKEEGVFAAAFTPKKPSPGVQRIVESADPRFTGAFRLLLHDNPGITDNAKELQVSKAAAYGAHMVAAVLYGDWMTDDLSVFNLDEEKVRRSLPAHYNYDWPHVEFSDPANGSGFGFTLWAEDPTTSDWYLITAKVLSGKVIECNSVAARYIRDLTAKYNVVRRYTDPAALGYRMEARESADLRYQPGPNKKDNDFFWQSLERLQEYLGRRFFITEGGVDIFDELHAYRRSPENPDQIVAKKKYHLIDAARYFAMTVSPLKKPLQEDVTPWKDEERMEAVVEKFSKMAAQERERTKKPSLMKKITVRNTLFNRRR